MRAELLFKGSFQCYELLRACSCNYHFNLEDCVAGKTKIRLLFLSLSPKCYSSYFKGHKIIIHIRRQKHLDKIASSTLQDLVEVLFLLCLFDMRPSPVCDERAALRPVSAHIIALSSPEILNLNKCITLFFFWQPAAAQTSNSTINY